ncbi:MAG: M48 family metalloprotease [Burkholderiales bacterium]|nr:M48 family metalloprotease [Burkholderiales bacterium]
MVVESSRPPPTAAAPATSGASEGSWLPDWVRGSPKSAAPVTRNGAPIVPTIRTQLQCKTPPENYDFTSVIVARYGAEAALRLQRLLSTDFADGTISSKDREMLRYLAREMLWIPVQVEEKIGSALLLAARGDFNVLDNGAANQQLWDQTTQFVRELAAAAPPSPFDTQLILLQAGSPKSLAGGIVFIDNTLLKSVFDRDPPAAEMLRFVLAHELAHIQRRHRAKRIQQLMVDSDSGLKLMRQIFSRAKAGGAEFSPTALTAWIETASAVHDVARDLLKYHAKFEQDQEFEADACATALMMEAKAGNPLKAFQEYRADQEYLVKTSKTAETGTVITLASTHPPNAEREAGIKAKMEAFRADDRSIGKKELPFSASKAASAVADKGAAAERRHPAPGGSSQPATRATAPSSARPAASSANQRNAATR